MTNGTLANPWGEGRDLVPFVTGLPPIEQRIGKPGHEKDLVRLVRFVRFVRTFFARGISPSGRHR
jgi:hypothetical protein